MLHRGNVRESGVLVNQKQLTLELLDRKTIQGFNLQWKDIDSVKSCNKFMLTSCKFLLMEAREGKPNDFTKGALLHKSIWKIYKERYKL